MFLTLKSAADGITKPCTFMGTIEFCFVCFIDNVVVKTNTEKGKESCKLKSHGTSAVSQV